MKLFFGCFDSHLPSSSSKTMKFPSKCILSPRNSNGNREPSQISLSSSLSWKLRSNRSIRSGQASPMFPTVAKRKGGSFENPAEPTSPKVTCIGQVRVRTRKQGKKMRARSMRRKEASFRRTDQGFRAAANPNPSGQKGQNFEYQNHQSMRQESLPHRNQRWVHLPLTICEALRGFGAEFNSCFFPCWSSCKSSEKDGEDKAGGGTVGSGRGAAFAGWLAALEEGEEDRTDRLEGSHRKHVLEDVDIDEVKQDEFVGEEEEEEEKARVSLCIPPKNALLLMRCRSDPVKMAALANRFWESPAQKYEDKRQDNGDGEGEVEEDEVRRHIESPTKTGENDTSEEQVIPDEVVEAKVTKGFEEIPEVKPEDGGVNGNPRNETLVRVPSSEVQADLGKLEVEEVQSNMLQEGEAKLKEKEDDQIEQRDADRTSSPVVMDEKDSKERPREEKVTATRDRPDLDCPEKRVGMELKVRENQSEPEKGSNSVLPECLLLMMCEPKLSMEVSKETWVSNKDFIRRLPEKSVKKKQSGGGERKKKITVDSKPPLPQPPRSSCSYPAPAAGMSMATMIEQKLGESNACEPLVLKRCNSEPMGSSAILAPEACFWKNRKLEPNHPAATLGIGAAGVGF